MPPALLPPPFWADSAFLEAAALAAGITTAGSPAHILTLLTSRKAKAVQALEMLLFMLRLGNGES